MGDCQEQVKEYLKAFKQHHILDLRHDWRDSSLGDICKTTCQAERPFFLNERQILFDPRSELKESGG